MKRQAVEVAQGKGVVGGQRLGGHRQASVGGSGIGPVVLQKVRAVYAFADLAAPAAQALAVHGEVTQLFALGLRGCDPAPVVVVGWGGQLGAQGAQVALQRQLGDRTPADSR